MNEATIGGQLRYTYRGRVILIEPGEWGHWFWTDAEFKDDGPDNPLTGWFTADSTLREVFTEIRDAVDDWEIENAER